MPKTNSGSPLGQDGVAPGRPQILLRTERESGGKTLGLPRGAALGPPGRAPERQATPRGTTPRFRRPPRSHSHVFNRISTRDVFSYFFPSPGRLARERLHRRENAFPKSLFPSTCVGAHTPRRTRFFRNAPRARRPAAQFFLLFSSPPFITIFYFSSFSTSSLRSAEPSQE